MGPALVFQGQVMLLKGRVKLSNWDYPELDAPYSQRMPMKEGWFFRRKMGSGWGENQMSGAFHHCSTTVICTQEINSLQS